MSRGQSGHLIYIPDSKADRYFGEAQHVEASFARRRTEVDMLFIYLPDSTADRYFGEAQVTVLRCPLVSLS